MPAANREDNGPNHDARTRSAAALSRAQNGPTPPSPSRPAEPIRRYNAAMDFQAFEEIKSYAGFDDADARRLAGLVRPLSPEFPAVVDRFYEVLFRFPRTRAVFSGPAQVERLRKTLLVWLVELFSGEYGAAYLETRSRIGRMHVRVGLPQEYMFASMTVVRAELSRRILNLSLNDAPAILAALHKLLDIELAIMNGTYRESMVARMQALERAQFEQRLRESEHLATIGQLAASVAHEIKNPLAGISGAIQVIGAEFGPDHPHREVIVEVMRQIDRLDAAVRDLLVYARPKPPSRSVQDIAGVLGRAMRLFREEPAFRNVQVQCDGLDSELPVRIDEDQIEQVVSNLLLNAAQACNGGGRIDCGLRPSDNGVRITITDTGPGIKPDVLPRVFEPFYTTKARGTGLGLSICKRIIEAHGGTIQIDSAAGRGTRVTVDIPNDTCQDHAS